MDSAVDDRLGYSYLLMSKLDVISVEIMNY